MISFLKTILILLLVYLGLKIIIRLITPYLMRFLAKKVKQRFENSFGKNPFQTQDTYKDEAINNNKKTSSNPSSKKVVGEYIDFEEVE